MSLFFFSDKSFFSLPLECMQDLKKSMCVSVCSSGASGFSFSAACLPCLSLTGSEGVSWEEICGVIQPGPLQFKYSTESCQMNGNPITAPYG